MISVRRYPELTMAPVGQPLPHWSNMPGYTRFQRASAWLPWRDRQTLARRGTEMVRAVTRDIPVLDQAKKRRTKPNASVHKCHLSTHSVLPIANEANFPMCCLCRVRAGAGSQGIAGAFAGSGVAGAAVPWGNVTKNVAPLAGELSTRICPPWAWAILLHMARPTPMPSYSSWEWSRRKSWKIFW